MKLITITNTIKEYTKINNLRNAVQTFEVNPMQFFMESQEFQNLHEHEEQHTNQEEDNVTKIKVTTEINENEKKTEL